MSLDHLVSVITPVHNDTRYLRRVVESVAGQTVAVLEHIIVDDGSHDETPEILARLAQEFSGLVLIHQKRAGAAVARNRGIEAARGRYIAFLDADDVWHPRKVERQVRFMEDRGVLFSFGDYLELDELGRHRQRQYRLPPVVGHRQLLRGCPIGCLTVAYNQEVLGKRYMPVVRSGHDWGLWLSLTREGIRAVKYPGLEAAYTNGKVSLSSRKLDKVRNVYRLYRETEGLSRARAAARTVQHAAVAVAKKSGLIY
ncbi:MAG: glycosyltransferase family 2 protein [Spirochaetaceae bacterium]